MTSKLIYLGSSIVATAVFAVAAPAFAAGTTAGTTITNTAFVDYQVGGVSQGQLSDSDAFVVDRKINLTVAEVGSITTTVVPGQPVAVTTFTVTNTSNQVLDFLLTSSQLGSGTAAHGGTDTFNVTGLSMFVDTNGNGTYESGTDTAITFIDELAADASRTIFLVGAVPAGLGTGAVAGVTLTATAREGGTATTQGAAISETTTANTAGIDTVFADTAGVTEGARSGSHSDDDDYTVSTATLTVDKTSRVISDPFNGTSNPKLIPGAVVEYCIAVSNAAGGADATSVSITDNVPTALLFTAGSIVLNGTVTSGTCNADGAAGGTFTDPQVAGTIATIAAGSARTLIFRATVK